MWKRIMYCAVAVVVIGGGVYAAHLEEQPKAGVIETFNHQGKTVDFRPVGLVCQAMATGSRSMECKHYYAHYWETTTTLCKFLKKGSAWYACINIGEHKGEDVNPPSEGQYGPYPWNLDYIAAWQPQKVDCQAMNADGPGGWHACKLVHGIWYERKAIQGDKNAAASLSKVSP